MNNPIKHFINQVTNLEFDKELPNYKQTLIKQSEIDKLLVLSNQFFYVTDMEVLNNVYVHPNIEKVLGYSQKEFQTYKMIYNLLHPDDQAFVLKCTLKTIEYTRKPDACNKDKTQWVFSLTFRFLHKSGHYVWVERHACCYKSDRLGNMVYALCFYTDITHIKKNNYIDCNWHTNEAEPIDISGLINEFKASIFTKRETEIIGLIAEGLTAKQIAALLCIADETVMTHRKNILRKANATNCAQLVRFAIDHGIIS